MVAKDPLEDSLYSRLGLNLTASLKDVKEAYRREALVHHPDRSKGDADTFREIQEAYDVLKDIGSRASYNRTLSTGAGKKKKKVIHLTPMAPVKQALIIDCKDGRRRTVDTHESAFKMPLRHGDQIETNKGEIGVIIGMFDCFVYWWKNGSKNQGFCLGERDELASPSFGGLKYKKLTTAAKAQAARTMSGMPYRSRSAPRPGRRTSVKKQPAGSGDRRKLQTAEQTARTKLQQNLWHELNQLIVKCQSDIDVLVYKQKRERNRHHIISQTHQPPSPRIRRHTSAVFSTPRAPTPTYGTPKKQPVRSDSRKRLIKRGATLRKCSPGCHVKHT
eukprot:TRINITY_DN17186_c0_g1_i1.p1 TRINITY_DN17186_c0_g1~~TRINITY_DN17186_c0_g1_i1.p1  ORF type:complete len:332 (+),score=65.42 TRINITY_DN17186_c0_g1_i1:86-1081(+)